MLQTLVASLLLGYAPGALLFRAPIGRRELRAALRPEERAFWAVVISVCWSLAVVLALAALHRYSFLRLITVVGISLLLVIAFYRGRLLYGLPCARPTVASVAPVLLILLGSWLYFPSSEYVMGGKDPGVYLVEGVQIAQRGALEIVDEDVASVPTPLRDLFFPSHRVPWYYGTRFMGFFVENPDRGTVFAQFPHLFPASIAIGYGLNGLTGARQTVAVWAILGLVAVYFTAARLIGRPAAFAAAVLLGANVMEVWFGRYPNSEIALQALLFAALAGYVQVIDGDRAFFGPVVAALLSLGLFLRVDGVVALAGFTAAASISGFAGRPIGRGFFLLIALGTAAGIWYLLVPMAAYSAGFFGFWRDSHGWILLAVGLAVCAAARALARSEASSTALRRTIPIALAAGLLLLAVYAYFFRYAGGRLAYGDAESLRSFAWYVTRAGLAAGVLGFVVLAWRSFWTNPALFLTVALYSVLFFYKARIVPEHFWMTRRFLVAVLPATTIGIAALAAAVAERMSLLLRGATPRARAWTAWTLVAALLLPFAYVFRANAAPVRRHVEYAGLIPRLEELASRIGDNDLLLVESRNASDLHVLALPLAYIYARHVLVLNSPRPAKPQLEAFMLWARSRYSRVLFLGGGGTDLLSRRITAEPLESIRFQVPEYASTLNAYPSGARMKEFDFGLYQVDPVPQDASGPIVVTVGRLDDLRVVRFYAKETRPDGTPFRWTKEFSYVLLLPFRGDFRTVTIWMSTGGRPASAPAPVVTVSFDGTLIGSATPVDAVRSYTLQIPPAIAARAAKQDDAVLLRLDVPTWNPHAALGAGDDRSLGVIVTRVEVR